MISDINEPGIRQQAQRLFDATSTKQNYDTTHTSRPDAVPMWDDLGRVDQDVLIVAWDADGTLYEYAEVQWYGSETAVIESETNPWLSMQPDGSQPINLIEFANVHGHDYSDECDQCGRIMRGVIEGMDFDAGIQRCDQCELFDGDLEAARALLAFMPEGTAVWFNGTN